MVHPTSYVFSKTTGWHNTCCGGCFLRFACVCFYKRHDADINVFLFVLWITEMYTDATKYSSVFLFYVIKHFLRCSCSCSFCYFCHSCVAVCLNIWHVCVCPVFLSTGSFVNPVSCLFFRWYWHFFFSVHTKKERCEGGVFFSQQYLYISVWLDSRLVYGIWYMIYDNVLNWRDAMMNYRA